MTGFQHLAVGGADGPRVTLAAGIEMAGCSWSTTSGTAAKVRSIRSHPHAAVLSAGEAPRPAGVPAPDGADGADDQVWTLLAGRATIVDPRRPLAARRDPLAASLVGVALARIGLEHGDQLLGYLHDACNIPAPWRPGSRVVIVVHGDHRLVWRAGAIIDATGAFRTAAPLPSARRQRPRRTGAHLDMGHLSVPQAALVSAAGPCAVGLSTDVGPVAIPGWWDPTSRTIEVRRPVLAHLHAALPGPCSVTLDDSSDARPAAKIGVMLRGPADLVAGRRSGDSVVLALDVRRVTSWDGFTTHGSPVEPNGARA